jgi:GTPase Era involved in 16S rRNA processing
VIVLNKVDKLKQSELAKAKKIAKEKFFWQTIVTYSAKTGKNHKELLNAIFHLLD